MLYKRGAIWWTKVKAGGETYRRSTGTASKREAQEYERKLRAEIARELHAQRTGRPAEHTYGDAVLKWINTGAPKSMWSHARNTRPYLEDVKLHLVVPAAHMMKQDMLRRKLSPQTINRRLAVVRRILNVAYREWNWLSEPLGQKIQLMSEKGLEREVYLDYDEVLRLLGAVDDPEAAKVIILAAHTGLRRGELRKLKPANWQPPYIVLGYNTKGKRPRRVPVIEEMHQYVTPPFQVTEYQLRKAFETAREAIGRPDIRFHDLRHTFASWLARDPNIPLTMIRDLLGHSSLSVTSRYAHLRGNTVDLVSKALKGAQKGAQADVGDAEG